MYLLCDVRPLLFNEHFLWMDKTSHQLIQTVIAYNTESQLNNNTLSSTCKQEMFKLTQFADNLQDDGREAAIIAPQKMQSENWGPCNGAVQRIRARQGKTDSKDTVDRWVILCHEGVYEDISAE